MDKDFTDEERYGSAWINIIRNRTKEGLSVMRSLSSKGIIEADLVLAMFTEDMVERKNILAKVAASEISEGLWEYCGCLEHSYCPDPRNPNDRTWEKYCLMAAQKGSVDAMNEMGNVANRRSNPIEAMYWYAMANCNDHPDASISLEGNAKKWMSLGCPTVAKTNSPYFTDAKRKVALSYLELYSGLELSCSPDEIISLVLDGEPLAGYFAGDMFESNGNDEMAYRMYNILAHDGDAHGTKCYADMLMTGKGTEQDVRSAVRMYERAAQLGERSAMFVMGEIARVNNSWQAAYWYGLSHTRGYSYALTRLQQLVD